MSPYRISARPVESRKPWSLGWLFLSTHLLACAPVAVAVGTVGALSTGCTALAKIAPVVADVITAIDEAQLILSEIDARMLDTFKRFPNAEAEANYRAAMTAARESLRGAVLAARGSQDLTAENADAAFAKFREAYRALIAACNAAGGLKAGEVEQWPEPLVMRGPVSP